MSIKKLENFYKNNFKKLLLVPILLILFSCFTIYETIQKEDFAFYRDVSLKGGISSILELENVKISNEELQKDLENTFEENTFSIKYFSLEGEIKGFIIDSDLEEKLLIEFLEKKLNIAIDRDTNYSSNFTHETLSKSFISQTISILIFSIILMSLIVFLYFRNFIPSLAVVISVIFDLVVLIGVLNFLEFKISTAGIGAILMIIGYSIDTDILLTNRLLKDKNPNIFEASFESFKTGNLMSITTIVSLLVALILTNSSVIFEISFILLIGLIIDYISTWIQNLGILLMYFEKKKML